MNKFSEFRFPQAINEALAEMGYVHPTPVQSRAIPLVLEGKDLLVTAQTGTGKTAAFAIPLLSRMIRGPKLTEMRPVLIVAPTRELAEQTGQVLEKLVSHAQHIKTAVIIGGSSYPKQIRALRSKPLFVVGTPGRLLDQVEMGHLDLSNFGTLVIDEADRLLDMGFEPQMIQIVSHLPADRQSLLFSATIPEDIVRLASKFLRDPSRVTIGETAKPVEKIRQKLITVSASKKDETLIREIDKVAGSIIVFTRTKSRTERVATLLEEAGHYVTRIHGDRTQSQRSAALAAFRDGSARILVATDIAARGIDVPHIQHVVNYDLPVSPEDYIHRIGRTARNGADGNSLAFVTPEEMQLWARIFKLIHGHFPEGYRRPQGPPTATGKSGKGGQRTAGGARGKSARPMNREERRRAGDRGSAAAKPAARFERAERPAKNRAESRGESPRGQFGARPRTPEARKPRTDDELFESGRRAKPGQRGGSSPTHKGRPSFGGNRSRPR